MPALSRSLEDRDFERIAFLSLRLWEVVEGGLWGQHFASGDQGFTGGVIILGIEMDCCPNLHVAPHVCRMLLHIEQRVAPP